MVELTIRDLALIVAGAGISGVLVDLVNRYIPTISQVSKSVVMFGGLLGYYYLKKYTGIREYLSKVLLGVGVALSGDLVEGVFRALVPV